MSRKTGITVAAALAIFVVLLAGVGLIYIYAGAYNVAATDPHAQVVYWTLSTTQVQSVRSHAESLEEPLPSDSAALRMGFHHFEEMCVTCHGAPGVSPSEIGKGLNPEPPELSEMVERYSPGELYWIVKNGLKMTGMPAFGPTHSEEELRAIVAFLQRLPELTPEEYQAMSTAGESGSSGHGQAGGQQHEHSH